MAVQALAAGAQVAGSALSAYGKWQAGQNASRIANWEAGQMEGSARQARAVSQRRYLEEKRQAQLVESRALALAAAGGGAADVGTINIIGDIKAEGKYRSLVALFEGEDAAQKLELQAQVRREEGRAARRAANLNAFSSVLSSAGSLASRYGGS